MRFMSDLHGNAPRFQTLPQSWSHVRLVFPALRRNDHEESRGPYGSIEADSTDAQFPFRCYRIAAYRCSE
jgi:hypothetical protein